MKPATELPWDQLAHAVYEKNGDKKVAQCTRTADASYVRHACNAYPKLVEALRVIAQKNAAEDSTEGFNEWGEADCFHQCRNEAAALLRELGEET